MLRKILISGLASAVAGSFTLFHTTGVTAADPIPVYTTALPQCDNVLSNTPCHIPERSDSTIAILAECSSTVTNFCYSATVDGAPAPSGLKFVARVTAFDTSNSNNRDAQFDATLMAFRVPSGKTLNKTDAFGWGKRPADQFGDAGKIDLTGVASATSNIKVDLKFKTPKVPQYSVIIADEGSMKFSLTGQDVSVTLEGKPARVAIESAAQHIDFDTEKNDSTTLPWTNRCGIPSMNFVVCNVDTAESAPLVFYSRMSTFVNSPAADVPGPIWVSTNATYFHQPSISINGKGKRSLQVKTAAPHLRPDGSLNEGSFTAFLSSGILTQWGIEKTDAALNKALTTSITKGADTKTVERTFTITDEGVKIVFPKLSFSAPVVAVEESAATSTPTAPSTPASKTVKRGRSVALTSLIKPQGKGKATWKTSGGCKIAGSRLVAPSRKATCIVTLRQAKYRTTPASMRKVTVKVP